MKTRRVKLIGLLAAVMLLVTVCLVVFIPQVAGCAETKPVSVPSPSDVSSSKVLAPPLAPATFPHTSAPISAENAARLVELSSPSRGTLHQVIFSPDGKLLGVASSLGVAILTAQTLSEVWFSEVHGGAWYIAFSPNGLTLASSSELETIRLWRVADGKMVRAVGETIGIATGLAFSPDGQILATGSRDGMIGLWRVSDYTLLRTLVRQNDQVWSIAFSADGKLLASADTSSSVWLWRVEDGAHLLTLGGHCGEVRQVAFSPNSQMLATGSIDRTVKIWRTDNGALLRTLNARGEAVTGVAFSPDGSVLASASGSADMFGLDRSKYGAVQLWRTDDGALERTIEGQRSGVESLSFSIDGNTLATASENIRLWGASEGKLLAALPGQNETMWSVAYATDWQTAAAGMNDKSIALLRMADGAPLRYLAGHGDPNNDVRSLAFSPDGLILASASYFDARLWRVADGTLLQTLPQTPAENKGGVTTVAFSPDGRILATGSDALRLWRASDGTLLRTLEGNKDPIGRLIFSPDGILIAGTERQATMIRIWRVEDGSLVQTLEGHTNFVQGLAFSPDGTILASASWDQTIRLWRVRDWSLQQTLHSSRTDDVAFSRDGHLLAGVSIVVSAVDLWRVDDGSHLRNFRAAGAVSSSFSPDGNLLAIWSPNNGVRFWGVR